MGINIDQVKVEGTRSGHFFLPVCVFYRNQKKEKKQIERSCETGRKMRPRERSSEIERPRYIEIGDRESENQRDEKQIN